MSNSLINLEFGSKSITKSGYSSIKKFLLSYYDLILLIIILQLGIILS